MGGLFAIAESFRVKTVGMIVSRKRPASPISVVKLPLDCSVNLPLVLGWTRKMPRSRAVFSALSWRAAARQAYGAGFSYAPIVPPGRTFLMTGSRGLRDGYYFY
jgi:hypothetical protein